MAACPLPDAFLAVSVETQEASQFDLTRSTWLPIISMTTVSVLRCATHWSPARAICPGTAWPSNRNEAGRQ